MPTTIYTPEVDLSSLGYPEWYTHPMDYRLFEITPVIHRDWEVWSRSKKGFTGHDMFREMSDNGVISDAIGLPTLRYYANTNNQRHISESWLGSRVFGLRGVVVHRDGGYVAPYLDCCDVGQIYIGFFRLKDLLVPTDSFVVLQR